MESVGKDAVKDKLTATPRSQFIQVAEFCMSWNNPRGYKDIGRGLAAQIDPGREFGSGESSASCLK